MARMGLHIRTGFNMMTYAEKQTEIQRLNELISKEFKEIKILLNDLVAEFANKSKQTDKGERDDKRIRKSKINNS